MKPKEIKPKETKPIEYSDYSDYFLNELTEIGKNNQPIDYLDLTYNLKDSNIAPISFIKFKGPNYIFESIYNGDIALADVETE